MEQQTEAPPAATTGNGPQAVSPKGLDILQLKGRTIAELMEVFSIGRATVYRVLDRTKTTGTTDAETPH